ncbi:hypothetical protein MIR68_008185 [Amoeboaphelidium protococcarum]|nr:hypothetical protein MIR68_008185 [Amoeboaphelidium protococcarum]
MRCFNFSPEERNAITQRILVSEDSLKNFVLAAKSKLQSTTRQQLQQSSSSLSSPTMRRSSGKQRSRARVEINNNNYQQLDDLQLKILNVLFELDTFQSLRLDSIYYTFEDYYELFGSQQVHNDNSQFRQSGGATCKRSYSDQNGHFDNQSESYSNSDNPYNLEVDQKKRHLIQRIQMRHNSLNMDRVQQIFDSLKPKEKEQKQQTFTEVALKVLDELKAYREHSFPFLTKVNKREAPDYYDIIKQPMDLGTITKKVKQMVYISKAEFVADLELIWSNCLYYNSDPRSIYRVHATEMKDKCDTLVVKVPEINLKPLLQQQQSLQYQQKQFQQSMSSMNGGKMDEAASVASANRGTGSVAAESDDEDDEDNNGGGGGGSVSAGNGQVAIASSLSRYARSSDSTSLQQYNVIGLDSYDQPNCSVPIKLLFAQKSLITSLQRVDEQYGNHQLRSACGMMEFAFQEKLYKCHDLMCPSSGSAYCPELQHFANSMSEVPLFQHRQDHALLASSADYTRRSWMLPERTARQYSYILSLRNECGDLQEQIISRVREGTPTTPPSHQNRRYNIVQQHFDLSKSMALVSLLCGFTGIQSSCQQVLKDLYCQFVRSIARVFKEYSDSYGRQFGAYDLLALTIRSQSGSTARELLEFVSLPESLINRYQSSREALQHKLYSLAQSQSLDEHGRVDIVDDLRRRLNIGEDQAEGQNSVGAPSSQQSYPASTLNVLSTTDQIIGLARPYFQQKLAAAAMSTSGTLIDDETFEKKRKKKRSPARPKSRLKQQ